MFADRNGTIVKAGDKIRNYRPDLPEKYSGEPYRVYRDSGWGDGQGLAILLNRNQITPIQAIDLSQWEVVN